MDLVSASSVKRFVVDVVVSRREAAGLVQMKLTVSVDDAKHEGSVARDRISRDVLDRRYST